MLLKYLFSTQIIWCFTWPDGRVYDGQWHTVKPHGEGKYIPKGEIKKVV